MKNITILIAFIAFYLFHNHNTLAASEFDLSSGNGLSQEDYFEKVLLIRDPLVVDNPLRTGLNPIKKITQTDDGGIMITTKISTWQGDRRFCRDGRGKRSFCTRFCQLQLSC